MHQSVHSPSHRLLSSPGDALVGMHQPVSRAEGERYEDA